MDKNINSPLVSIIMCTYNGEKFISECIESVLIQSYPYFEFIIVNDASIDSTESIILKYQQNDKRVIYVKNSDNLKIPSSANIGINKSQWKYIARIDDDDVWIKNKLEKQVHFLETHGEHWAVWSSIINIDKNWIEQGKTNTRETDTEIRKNILKSNQFAQSSMLLRKSILEDVGLYNESYDIAEDYDLWLRIWRVSKFYNISEYLIKYRWLETSMSRKKWVLMERKAFQLMWNNRKFYPKFYISCILRIITFVIPEKLKKIVILSYKKLSFK